MHETWIVFESCDFSCSVFWQTNVYLNKGARYGISEQAIVYAIHTWWVSVKRRGSTASPTQSGDQVKTCSLVFLDHIRYEFSMIFFHGYDDKHTHTLRVLVYLRLSTIPGFWNIVELYNSIMDPTILPGLLPLFLIRLWRKSRMWNPFIMKIVVTSTCRRTETLTITHLSRGLVERVESILVERCWTPIFVGRASRVKGETYCLGWGFDFGRMGFQWIAFW